jgi:hypothetical protein
VGLAFATAPAAGTDVGLPEGCRWFASLPAGLYEEQAQFLARVLGLS